MKISKKIIAVALLAVTNSTALFAQTGVEVMKKNEAQILANDEQFEIMMTLTNDKGKNRVRELKQVTKRDNLNNRSSLITFSSPADVKGTGFLAIENPKAEDDQWLYLPALNKTRRISAADKSDNFMGSDLAYEDLDTEETSEYDYKLTGSKTIGNVDHFVIEATPNNAKKKKESGYSKRILFVRKDNYMFSLIKYFDKNNELVKELQAADIRIAKDSKKWRAYKIIVNNIKTGHKTTLVYKNIIINKGVSNDAFSKRNLEKGI